MRRFFLILAIFAVAMNLCVSAQATNPEAAERDARVAAISKTLRCVVCQNQSIYDSNAPLAEDMRRLVEKRVVAGDSDDEVRDYLRERYGDYVLMTPPLQSNTLLLWLGPLVLLLLAGTWFVVRVRRKTVIDTADDLSDDDRARAHAALFGDKDDAS
ncbi:MAG: cytochrome c-type biogenesis protein [Henriciella sp.]|jgi:cytochrome c-type biogenesis protein CcmH